MKNLIKSAAVLVFALCTCVSMTAQTVDGHKLSEIPADYVTIVATQKLLKPFQVTVYADWGQISSMKEIKKGHILDDDGKLIKFNGVMGALNAFSDAGWELDNPLLLSTGSGSVYYYILKRTQ